MLCCFETEEWRGESELSRDEKGERVKERVSVSLMSDAVRVT